MKNKINYKIGIISDTHGLLRPEVIHEFKDVDMIIHAGDIGSNDVLESLESVANVYCVRGNTDNGELAAYLPKTEVIEVGNLYLYLIHDINELDLNPAAAGFNAVVFGHSHIPKIRVKDGVHFFNPGSAGPKRFKMPTSAGILYISDESINGVLINLDKKHDEEDPL